MTIAYFQKKTFPSPMATFSQGKGLRLGPQLHRKGEVLEGLQGAGAGPWRVSGGVKARSRKDPWALDMLRRGGPGPPPPENASHLLAQARGGFG